MNRYLLLFFGLFSAPLLLAVACPPQASALDGSGCPTVTQFIPMWYGDGKKPGPPDSPLKYWGAEYPFTLGEKHEFGDLCLDEATNNEWCGCKGDACLTEKKNSRLTVQYNKFNNRWVIKFSPEINRGDIHNSMSSCLLVPKPKNLEKFELNWINYDAQIFPLLYVTHIQPPDAGGYKVSEIEFPMPPVGTVHKTWQICMWEIKMDGVLYHEHFSTNSDCFAWVEVKATPPSIPPPELLQLKTEE